MVLSLSVFLKSLWVATSNVTSLPLWILPNFLFANYLTPNIILVDFLFFLLGYLWYA